MATREEMLADEIERDALRIIGADERFLSNEEKAKVVAALRSAATPDVRADAPTIADMAAMEFCKWLLLFFKAHAGKDELNAEEANTIRNALNVIAPLVSALANQNAPTRDCGPMVPWELKCQQEVCTAPECGCPAADVAANSARVERLEALAKPIIERAWQCSEFSIYRHIKALATALQQSPPQGETT